MIKTKTFNNIKTEPEFKRNDVKIFEWLSKKPDPVNKGKLEMAVMAFVPNKDRVYDPAQDDYVDIAAIKNLGPEDKPVFTDIVFEKRQGGKLVLRGDRIGDKEIYQFMMLSNYNISNPNRDPQAKGLYKLVDPKSESANKRKKRSTLRDAMNVAAEMSASDIREFVASMGKDQTRDISVLRDEIETLAESDPQQFIILSKNRNRSIQANIKKAIDKKIIEFSKGTSTFVWASTKETICQVPRTSGSSHLEGFVNFVLSNKNGQSIYEEIVKLLK